MYITQRFRSRENDGFKITDRDVERDGTKEVCFVEEYQFHIVTDIWLSFLQLT